MSSRKVFFIWQLSLWIPSSVDILHGYMFLLPLCGQFGQEIPSGVSIAHWGQALKVCILLPELGMLKKKNSREKP